MAHTFHCINKVIRLVGDVGSVFSTKVVFADKVLMVAIRGYSENHIPFQTLVEMGVQ
jgi:hypothetical protein